MLDRNYIELKPIKEYPGYQDLIEKKIVKLFLDELYTPIIIMLNQPVSTIKNSKMGISILINAIKEEKIYYSEGQFYGKFNAYISKELQFHGAKWDKKNNSYKIEMSQLPMDVRLVIAVSQVSIDDKLKKIERKLEEIASEDLSDKLNISSILDRNLFKLEKDFQKSIENITVEPQLTDEQRKKLADEWENNMRLYIKTFSDDQIKELRQKVKENVNLGIRRENLIKIFQESYGVTYNKAKFWAHQETNLMMAKYKETKYVSAGIPEYKWACVHMPHQSSPQAIYKPGDVRYSHGILEGKIFNWNDPPVTTPPDQAQRRNNPGQDYNCRCFAIPVYRFKK